MPSVNASIPRAMFLVSGTTFNFMKTSDFFQLGVDMALMANGRKPAELHKIAAVAHRMASPDAVPAKRMVIKSAHDVMTFCGDEFTAPSQHLAILSNMPGWSTHAEDVYNTVVKSCSLAETLEKRAFADTVEGVGSLAKTLGYAGIGAGAGLGTLYWLLARHANQGSADVESKKHQLAYYNRLNAELKDSMQRRYQYAPEAAA